MKKCALFVLSFCALFFFGIRLNPKPKLVIGIVVDQMRYDYLQTFRHLYSPDGFNRLMQRTGFPQRAVQLYSHIYGAGHSAVYTGTSPAVNGIAANEWYDRATGKEVYCTQDNDAKSVGNAEASAPPCRPKTCRCPP